MSRFCAKYMPQMMQEMPAYNRGEHGVALTQVFHKMDDMLRQEKFYAEVQRCVRVRIRSHSARPCVTVARRELPASDGIKGVVTWVTGCWFATFLYTMTVSQEMTLQERSVRTTFRN